MNIWPIFYFLFLLYVYTLPYWLISSNYFTIEYLHYLHYSEYEFQIYFAVRCILIFFYILRTVVYKFRNSLILKKGLNSLEAFLRWLYKYLCLRVSKPISRIYSDLEPASHFINIIKAFFVYLQWYLLRLSWL